MAAVLVVRFYNGNSKKGKKEKKVRMHTKNLFFFLFIYDTDFEN